MENKKDFDKTERILLDILVRLKTGFEITNCNKTAAGYLDSYNIVKEQLINYNSDLKVRKIYERNNI
jgi:hypothetical protein